MSQPEDEKEEKENPYWAPTNFTDWDNDYRLPAVLSFCIFFGAIILWVIIGWPVFKKIRKSLEETGNKEVSDTVKSMKFQKKMYTGKSLKRFSSLKNCAYGDHHTRNFLKKIFSMIFPCTFFWKKN